MRLQLQNGKKLECLTYAPVVAVRGTSGTSVAGSLPSVLPRARGRARDLHRGRPEEVLDRVVSSLDLRPPSLEPLKP